MKNSPIVYTVYILRTSGNTLYIGQTNNIEKRLSEHKSGKARSAKYMRYFESFDLVYTETFETRSLAMKREYALKKLTRKQKEDIVMHSLEHKSSE